MRGNTDPQLAMSTSLSAEELIAQDHPIRRIRVVVDAVLAERLLEHEAADEFFEAVVRLAKLGRHMSSEHFSVDGTLLKAWASHKSFKPKDGPSSEPPAGRNSDRGWLRGARDRG